MKVAIIGTGFAGYGALIALARDEHHEIHVFDVGLKDRYPEQADKAVANAKKYKGSFFPYGINDHRWSVQLDSQRICSSHAFGGHSTVYSGAVLYPKGGDLEEWPEGSRPRSGDYKAVLENMKILHDGDELSVEFPVVPEDADLSLLKKTRAEAVLGLSRIALEQVTSGDGDAPHLFRTDVFFEKQLAAGRINYIGNCYVLKLDALPRGVRVHVENGDDRSASHMDFDAVFIGAGCVNTTGIVDRSLFGEGSRKYELKNVGSAINAFIKFPGRKSKAHAARWASSLPEFFLEVNSHLTRDTWMHTQITAINEQIIDAIDSKIPFFGALMGKMLRKCFYFSLTTIHSRHSDRISLRCTSSRRAADGKIDHSIFVQEMPAPQKPRGFRSAVQRGVRSNRTTLRMVAFPFGSVFADFFRGNKLGGWHFGGTLPMASQPEVSQCLASGEVCGLKGAYAIDSAAFPEVPGSTVALLTAAHAHRVVRTWMEKNGN
jgi:hypothetical protein